MSADYDLHSSDESYYYDDISSDFYSDDSQLFAKYQLHQSTHPKAPLPLPEINIPDPSIAICHSIEQSQQLIQKQFNRDSSTLRTNPIPGIVILPLKDFNLIRKDHRNNREFKHILVLPAGENFSLVHKDFAQVIQLLCP